MRFLSYAAAAVFAAFLYVSAPAPAQASVALSAAGLTNVEITDVSAQRRYYRGGRYHYRGRPYYRGPRYAPRRCWNQRVRVVTPSGRVIWRTVRRCR